VNTDPREGPLQVVQIRCFLAVAESLSYRGAAQALHYAPSHVSQQVRQLESELGVALFERSTHHVTLTTAGRRLLPEAREYLLAHARILEAADAASSGIAQTLRVCYSSGSGTVAALAIRAYSTRYPDVTVSLTQVSNTQLADDLSSGTAAAGFALSTLDLPTGLSCVVLHQYAQDHLAFPPDHPLARRKRLTVLDLEGQRLLLPSTDKDTTHGRRILDFLYQRGIVVNPRFYPFASEEEAVDIVSAGLGVVLVGSSTWHRLGAWPEICIRRLDGDVPTLAQLMIWRDADPSPLTASFLHVARSSLQSMGDRQPAPVSPRDRRPQKSTS
jgi:DNA-binding transcriptional LysR family regulator